MKQNLDYFRNLCIKRFADEITENEQTELNDWINESSENLKEFQKIEKMWAATKKPDDDLFLDLNIEWNKLESRISENVNVQVSILSKLSDIIFSPKLRPAFALGTLVVLTISLIFLLKGSPENNFTTIATANNQIIELQLSDGSFVMLNSGSTISYMENFEEEQRRIELDGEAFFSVKKDGRPFIISTNNAVTTVLGTEFNVWARNMETRVIVKEGKVSLTEGLTLKKQVILTEGQTSKIIESLPPTEPEKVDAQFLLGWLDRKLVFNNSPLDEIIAELERFYDTSITLGALDPKSHRLTGSFKDDNLETVLSKMCLALNLQYSQNTSGFVVTK